MAVVSISSRLILRLTCLPTTSRVAAARAKADIHIAALASVTAPMPLGNPGGGMFDMMAGSAGGGAAMGGFPGLGGGSAAGLMDMLGAGTGGGAGGAGMGELMSMLMGGAGGAGGAGGGAGEGVDKKKMLKTAKKMSKVSLPLETGSRMANSRGCESFDCVTRAHTIHVRCRSLLSWEKERSR